MWLSPVRGPCSGQTVFKHPPEVRAPELADAPLHRPTVSLPGIWVDLGSCSTISIPTCLQTLLRLVSEFWLYFSVLLSLELVRRKLLSETPQMCVV